MRITFKKVTKRACGDPQIYLIKVDGVCSGTIQQFRDKWFWYGSPGWVVRNTCDDPKSLDECKAEIKKAFKEPK